MVFSMHYPVHMYKACTMLPGDLSFDLLSLGKCLVLITTIRNTAKPVIVFNNT